MAAELPLQLLRRILFCSVHNKITRVVLPHKRPCSRLQAFISTHLATLRSKKMKRFLRFMGVTACLAFGVGIATSQTWQPLAHQPSFGAGAMLLLTDGSVLVHSEPNSLTSTSTDYSSWYKL